MYHTYTGCLENTNPGCRFLRETDHIFRQMIVFYVKLVNINDNVTLYQLISRNFDTKSINIFISLDYTRILYFTKGLGKYEILIPCEGKNYFPSRPKGHKILSLAAYGRSGKYF